MFTLQARAFSLWRNAQAARLALHSGNHHQMEACLLMLDWTAHAPGPASLRRCAETTRISLMGTPIPPVSPTAA